MRYYTFLVIILTSWPITNILAADPSKKGSKPTEQFLSESKKTLHLLHNTKPEAPKEVELTATEKIEKSTISPEDTFENLNSSLINTLINNFENSWLLSLDEINKVVVFGKDECAYLYKKICYLSFNDLKTVIIAGRLNHYLSQDGNSIKPTSLNRSAVRETIFLVGNNHAVDSKELFSILFESKIDREVSGEEFLDSKTQSSHETTKIPKAKITEYQKFDLEAKDIGFISSSNKHYAFNHSLNLIRGEYDEFHPKAGPINSTPSRLSYGYVPTEKHNGVVYDVCLELDSLHKSIPKLFAEQNLEEIINLVPNLTSSYIFEDSIKIIDGKLCYQTVQNIGNNLSSSYDDEESLQSLKKKWNLPFDKFLKDHGGLEKLASKDYSDLKNAWNSGKSTQEKVANLEKFWIKRVNYKLDDYDAFCAYYKANPEHNIVQAVTSIGEGRCVPINFALALSIHQLSSGKTPVRLFKSYTASVDKEQKEDTPIITNINTGDSHLHLKYIAKDPNSDENLLLTAEASTDTIPTPPSIDPVEQARKKKESINFKSTLEAIDIILKGRKELIVRKLKLTDDPNNTTFDKHINLSSNLITDYKPASSSPSTQIVDFKVVEDKSGVKLYVGPSGENKFQLAQHFPNITLAHFLLIYSISPLYEEITDSETAKPYANKNSIQTGFSLNGSTMRGQGNLKIHLPNGKEYQSSIKSTLDLSNLDNIKIHFSQTEEIDNKSSTTLTVGN